MPEFRRHFGKRCGQQAQQATIRGTPKAWEGARRAHEARSSPRDLIEVAPPPQLPDISSSVVFAELLARSP